MKMVKKILLGLVVLATAFAFSGCTKDDTQGAISGTGKKYSVSYTNDTTDAYRAYKATALKHAGGLVKVTFKDPTKASSSKIGVIFDLKDAVSGVKDAKGKAAKDFYAIAIGMENDGCFYVSQFTDIVDIQAKNFGATTTAKEKEPKEVEIVAYNKTRGNALKLPAAAADGSISLYIWYMALPTGQYSWAIYDLTDEQASQYDSTLGTFKVAVTPLDGGIIDKAFEAPTDPTKVPQNPIAFYAQVAPNTTLTGGWNVIGTYKEAEDAE